MLAAEQDQTEQELPESICQPRHVICSGAERGSQYLQSVGKSKAGFPRTVKPGAAPGRVKRRWPNEYGAG
jgi:hypothetical protein